MKKAWVAIVAVIAIFGFWAAIKTTKKSEDKEKLPGIQMVAQSYWTCPMHPQVHLDHSGECPICHMKLIQLKSQQVQAAAVEQESRSAVQTGRDQLSLIGIQRTEVERMDIRVRIPVAGRFVSSSTVAFQIYESDLRYIKSGLTFQGASSFYPEEEISGIVSSVDSIVDPTSRTVRVLGSVRKGPRGVFSETGFRGDIILVLKGRIAIPESSVMHTGSNDLVYVFAEGNQLTPKIVKLGLKSEGFFDVLEGLEIGQTISSGPNFLIDSESKIRAASIPEEGKENGKSKIPSCPEGQHWDIPMAMCMPGKG